MEPFFRPISTVLGFQHHRKKFSEFSKFEFLTKNERISGGKTATTATATTTTTTMTSTTTIALKEGEIDVEHFCGHA